MRPCVYARVTVRTVAQVTVRLVRPSDGTYRRPCVWYARVTVRMSDGTSWYARQARPMSEERERERERKRKRERGTYPRRRISCLSPSWYYRAERLGCPSWGGWVNKESVKRVVCDGTSWGARQVATVSVTRVGAQTSFPPLADLPAHLRP